MKPIVQTIPTTIVFLGRSLGAKSNIPDSTVSMIANWESKPKIIVFLIGTVILVWIFYIDVIDMSNFCH